MIHGLRKAANHIACGSSINTRYEWSNAQNCNCGTLLKALDPDFTTNFKAVDNLWGRLVSVVRGCCSNGWWEALDCAYTGNGMKEIEANKYCTVTGMTVRQLFAELERYGFEEGDWAEIEFAGGSGPTGDFLYRDTDHVSKFMLKRADELAVKRRAIATERLARIKAKKQTNDDIPQPLPIHVYS